MGIKRRCFTLLEMLLVLGLLSLVAGLIGMNIGKAVREQRFRTEVDIVVNQLRLAQDLMLIFRGDVAVKFEKLPNREGFSCELAFATKMPAAWDQQAKKRYILTHIHAIDFPDKLLFNPKTSSKHIDQTTLDVLFYSNGTRMSQGVMRLAASSSDTGTLARFINLPGYPAPIISLPTAPEHSSDTDASFNNELTALTASEVQYLKEKPPQETQGPTQVDGDGKK